MSSSNHRAARTVLIPWVIALVTLFGLNALSPLHALTKKSESPKTIGLSQLAGDIHPSGRFSNPLAYLAPTPRATTGTIEFPSLLLPIEAGRGHAVVQSLKGANRGRAPPGIAVA